MKAAKHFIILSVSLILSLFILSSCTDAKNTPSTGSTSDTEGISQTNESVSGTEIGSQTSESVGYTDRVTDTEPPKETEAKTESKPKSPVTASAPDPDFYLNRAPDSTQGEFRVYSFKGDPTKAAENYVSVLQDSYSLTLTDSYEDGTTLGWHLQKDDNENADVDVSVNCTGGIDWELWISFGSDVSLNAAETWDEPITPTVSGPTIPDPDAFFNYKLARNEDFYVADKDKHVLSFKADINVGSLAMEEYVSLFFDEKLGFELAGEVDETILYLHKHNLAFNYTGSDTIPDVIDTNNELQGDLLVHIQRNGQTGTALLTLYFKPNVFEFIDFGDRTSYSPTDCSGKSPSSNSHGNGGIYDSEQECNFCDGSGKCSVCDGYGYLYSSASDKNDRNCYSCHPSYGKCHYCNGTGKRR